MSCTDGFEIRGRRLIRDGRCEPRFAARRVDGVLALGFAALGAGLTAIFRWVARQPDLEARMPEFIGLLLVAGILYVIGVFCVDAVLLLSPSTLSDDVYRYQWDGWAQRAGFNPYLVFPNAPGLAWLQNPEHPNPPGEETPTIYPPLSELAYRLIATVPGYKRVSTALDLAGAGVLLLLLAAKRPPLHRVLAYAWNPTVLISFAMAGHFDSLAIVTFLAALFFSLPIARQFRSERWLSRFSPSFFQRCFCLRF